MLRYITSRTVYSDLDGDLCGLYKWPVSLDKGKKPGSYRYRCSRLSLWQLGTLFMVVFGEMWSLLRFGF